MNLMSCSGQKLKNCEFKEQRPCGDCNIVSQMQQLRQGVFHYRVGYITVFFYQLTIEQLPIYNFVKKASPGKARFNKRVNKLCVSRGRSLWARRAASGGG